MKKLTIAFLCLMLVLPLYAYADGTESQPQAQVESQPPEQTESQPPEQTESQPPEQTESQPPEQTESQPPEQTESQPPEQTESQPSDHIHFWDVTYTVPATCLEEGATAYGCSTCGAISVEVLPKLTTHTYDNVCDPHCNICDISREVPHKSSISTAWSSNSKGHWHVCTACGGQEDFGSHYPGPAATEEKAQICLTCGYTLTAKLKHQHKYDTKYTSDETGHWYTCSGCGERKDFKDHSYDDPCDPDCNVCGYVTTTAHSYSGEWSSDEDNHWDVCTLCGEESDPEAHIPGPEATEEEAQLCTACGFELMPAQEHVHAGEGAWLMDADAHWQVCLCGEDTEKQPHTWDEGVGQEDTTVLYTCEDCGLTRTEGEPKTGSGPWLWIGIAAAAVLAIAGVAVVLILKPWKRGKYN